MIKPTQHFVGYNPELVKELLNQIDFALDGELEYMHGVFYCFQSAMLGNDYGNFTGMVTGGWYAPEAKEFCEKIITPTAQKSYNNVFQKYINIYNDVVASAKKWGVSTGNVIALPPCPYRPKKLEMITVPPEKNGNVGIDPAIKEQVSSSYKKCRENLDWRFKVSKENLSKATAFLGFGQSRAIFDTVNRAHDFVLKESENVYNIAILRINEAIEKYEQTAQSVAGSFE